MIRVYIHAPRLPNTVRSLSYLLARLRAVGLDQTQPIIMCPDPAQFEYPTLRQLWLDAQDSDFHALYLHVKGASKTREHELKNAEAWMDWMLRGVVDDYRMCLAHLTCGADLVGSQYHWHFKGNFWWGRSAYLRQLPDPHLIGVGDRLNAEYWNCWGLWNTGWVKPNVKNLFYVKGLKTDADYVYVTDVEQSHVFVDRRLDPTRTHTWEEFLASGEKCAFDRIDVLSSAVRTEDFLNYDGIVKEVTSVEQIPIHR